MATKNYIWDENKMACIATYTVIGGKSFLNQFDDFFLSINEAGDTKLTTLPYFPKFSASSANIDGRADQMARKFFKFIVLNYTNRKEKPTDAVEDCIKNMRALFKSDSATIKDVAEVTDKFFKFNDE